MQVYISNREIEQIADGLIKVTCGEPPPSRFFCHKARNTHLRLSFRSSFFCGYELCTFDSHSTSFRVTLMFQICAM